MTAQGSIRQLAPLGLLLLFATTGLNAGIWLSAISGSALDEEGKPLAGAILRFVDPSNGRHFEITTAGDGRFNYIAIQPSHYKLEVIRTRHQAVTFPDIYLEWSARPLLLDIDLQTHSVKVTRQVMLAESYGAEVPLPSPPATDAAADDKARAVNEKLAATKRFIDAGDWDRAITTAKEATEIDPTRDLSWAWLATAFCEEARHDPQSSATALQNCVRNYQTAIAISPHVAYFNNLGAAYAALNDWANAAEKFRSAQNASQEHVALYHMNLGAALLKQSESQEGASSVKLLQSAAQEFASAANSSPPLNEAYYWKGLCELRLAGIEGSGSTFHQARESFARYLQLVPDGPYAGDSRAMLDALTASQASANEVPKP